MNPIEGDFLIKKDDNVAYVLGYFHNANHYYVYHKNPFKRRINQFYNRNQEIIFGIDVIEKKKIKSILTPEALTEAFLIYCSNNYDFIKKNLKKKPFFGLILNTYQLFQKFNNIKNFNIDSLLISDHRFLGSYDYLKKEFNPAFDNDKPFQLEDWLPVQLIVKNSFNISNFRRILRKLIEDKNETLFRPFDLKLIRKLYNLYPEAYKKKIRFFTQVSTDYRKLHHFLFDKTSFSFRGLENPAIFKKEKYDLEELFKIIPICELEISGQIKDNERWWNVPMVVKPDNVNISSSNINDRSSIVENIMHENDLKLNDIYSIYSHFEPNIETIRLLEMFKARGMLELIIPKKKIPKHITDILGINLESPCLRLNLDYKPDYFILPKI